jgi:hypothetical protein
MPTVAESSVGRVPERRNISGKVGKLWFIGDRN